MNECPETEDGGQEVWDYQTVFERNEGVNKSVVETNMENQIADQVISLASFIARRLSEDTFCGY